MKRLMALLVALTALCSAHAISFALDSIAEWGRFARFCVNVYRWGDKFFNGYDTTYVEGTGYKFNVKLRTDSWTDYYSLRFDNRTKIYMISDPSTSAGLYLTYLALSAGYDANLNQYFGGSDRLRKRWTFQFSCMLFSANLYFISNDVGTKIRAIKPIGQQTIRPDLDFHNVNNKEWGLSLSYFFTHKRYSNAAAFGFSRIQKRSGGSAFAGLLFSRQKYDFDFSNIPDEYKMTMPLSWTDYNYTVDTRNYYLKGGYAYNWVLNPKWMVGTSISPMIGISDGYIKFPDDTRATFGAYLQAQASLVYNSGSWFAGMVGSTQLAMVRNSERALVSGILNIEISGGFRFNIW